MYNNGNVDAKGKDPGTGAFLREKTEYGNIFCEKGRTR